MPFPGYLTEVEEEADLDKILGWWNNATFDLSKAIIKSDFSPSSSRIVPVEISVGLGKCYILKTKEPVKRWDYLVITINNTEVPKTSKLGHRIGAPRVCPFFSAFCRPVHCRRRQLSRSLLLLLAPPRLYHGQHCQRERLRHRLGENKDHHRVH